MQFTLFFIYNQTRDVFPHTLYYIKTYIVIACFKISKNSLSLQSHIKYKVQSMYFQHCENKAFVTGIQVAYDLSRPPQQRVVSALVRCGDCLIPKYYPLDRNKLYEVLVSSFLADGGDNYAMLKSIKERKDLCK